jgi:hypothetical protein
MTREKRPMPVVVVDKIDRAPTEKLVEPPER